MPSFPTDFLLKFTFLLFNFFFFYLKGSADREIVKYTLVKKKLNAERILTDGILTNFLCASLCVYKVIIKFTAAH